MILPRRTHEVNMEVIVASVTTNNSKEQQCVPNGSNCFIMIPVKMLNLPVIDIVQQYPLKSVIPDKLDGSRFS